MNVILQGQVQAAAEDRGVAAREEAATGRRREEATGDGGTQTEAQRRQVCAYSLGMERHGRAVRSSLNIVLLESNLTRCAPEEHVIESRINA